MFLLNYKVSMIRGYFLLFVYFIGGHELTKTSSPDLFITFCISFLLIWSITYRVRPLTLKLLSQDAKFYLQNTKCGNLILRKIIKFVATR